MDANMIHGTGLLNVVSQGKPKSLMVLRLDRTTALLHAHPLVEDFNSRNGTHLKVVSVPVADAALAPGPSRLSLPRFAVDAAIAYEQPGTKIGKHIVFYVEGLPKVVMEIGIARGEKDVALVAMGLTSADIAYTFQNKTRTLREFVDSNGIESLLAVDFKSITEIQLCIPDKRLIVVPKFPAKDGYYAPHYLTTVPQAPVVRDYQFARKLNRLSMHSYVGLMARPGGRAIGACFWLSEPFGVVAEVPDSEVAKLKALISAPALATAHTVLVQDPTPVAAPKTVLELPVAANGLRGLLARFGQDLKALETSAPANLLDAGRTLEALISDAMKN
jgi:hypothetical protein